MTDDKQNASTMEQLGSLRNFMDERRGRALLHPAGAAITTIEGLDVEVKRLEATLKKSEYERGIERKAADELVAKVERLEADNRELRDHSAARERTYNLLTTALDSYKAKVERLTAERDAARGDTGAALDLIERHGRTEGMEAAAVMVDEAEDPAATFYLARRIRTAAKEQTGEAGSKELRAPAKSAESSGSASPVDPPYTHCVQCGVLVDTRENDTPGAELTDGRWACSRECWDKAADEAETTAHRDGVDGKEQT